MTDFDFLKMLQKKYIEMLEWRRYATENEIFINKNYSNAKLHRLRMEIAETMLSIERQLRSREECNLGQLESWYMSEELREKEE